MIINLSKNSEIFNYPTAMTQYVIFRIIRSKRIHIGQYIEGRDNERFGGGEGFRYEIIGYANSRSDAERYLYGRT